MNLVEDLIKPLPSQRKLFDLMWTHEYVLFGGQAGPGKSYALRWAAIVLLFTWFVRLGLRDVTVGLFCEDYPALKDRQLTKIKREFPRWLGTIADTKEHGLCYQLRDKYGGGRIALRNLDDPSKYASAEFAAILVDELTKNDRQTFDDLRFRKRWPGIDHSPFLAASNPGSIGHAWVKKLWLDHDFTDESAELDPTSFVYLPARGAENPHLPESYWTTLASLPGPMRKAMLEGDWDLFTGQYFATWRRDLHVMEPQPLPVAWKRLISLDYGFAKPSSVGWWAVDPEGHWYRYRELYVTQLTYPALGQRILDLTPREERIRYAVADPAIWGDKPKAGETVGISGGQQLTELFKTRGILLSRANHERLNGWAACRKLLEPVATPDGGTAARLHIFSTCPAFIRTVPSLVHDEHTPEDLDSDGEDHCADEWRYAVNSVALQQLTEERRLHTPAYHQALAEIPSNGGLTFAGR